MINLHTVHPRTKLSICLILELLTYGDCNIIGVDWHPLALAINYIGAARNALDVGQVTGEFLVRLMEKTGLTVNQVNVQE